MVKTTKLRQRLKAIPAKLEAALRPQMEAFASNIVAQMKATVPVESGALRDSIGWTWGEAPKGAMTVGTTRVKGSGLFITIYAGTRNKALGDMDAYYARWVEFGTSDAKAQPYFFPVWRANRRRVRSGVNRAARNALKSS